MAAAPVSCRRAPHGEKGPESWMRGPVAAGQVSGGLKDQLEAVPPETGVVNF